ncbi:MAG: DoxX family protein [Ilumatobacteraceae bacterium]
MTLPQLIARPLLAGMFVYGGQDSVRHGDPKVAKADKIVGPITSATGLDAAQLVKINGAVQVVAGTALAFGVFPRPAAAVLALSVIPTTLAGHRFWEERGPARNAQTVQFLKNAAMLGGLVLAATSTGGRPSVPWRARRALRHVVEGSAEKLGELRPAG